MGQANQTAIITNVIFETFRLHGRLIAFGDQMVGEFGLTSARWQVLGSIALAQTDMTVPNIARNMSLSRQAVQRVANDLEGEGLILYTDNPHHKRAKLVCLTPKGRKIYTQATDKYSQWATEICDTCDTPDFETALSTLRALDGFCAAYLAETKKGVRP